MAALDIPDGAAPIAVALDGMEEGRALALARALAGTVWGFKVHDLLLRSGAEVIPRLRHYGRVFCDPKLHDIPDTVAHQAGVLGRAGADLITVHCSGGLEMLRAAAGAERGKANLLGVTVLTSLDEAAAQKIYGRGREDQVRQLMAMALEADLEGIVCGATDLALVAQCDPGHELLRVTPGIRPRAPEDNQAHAKTPAAAVHGGADLLVIGRSITEAADPVGACARISQEMRAAGADIPGAPGISG